MTPILQSFDLNTHHARLGLLHCGAVCGTMDLAILMFLQPNQTSSYAQESLSLTTVIYNTSFVKIKNNTVNYICPDILTFPSLRIFVAIHMNYIRT